MGCSLLKADDVGHRLLEPQGAAFARVVGAFGAAILDANGHIDRAKLGKKVFHDVASLETLNQIIHPLVFAEEERFFREVAEHDESGIAVVEAAILIETGNHKSFEKLIVAWCPAEMQVERAMHRGLSREQAEARLAHQLPLREKLALADAVVDTSGSKEQTRLQVLEVYSKLRAWEEEARGNPPARQRAAGGSSTD